MSAEFTIRVAGLADAGDLGRLAEVTFPLACPPGVPPSDIEKFLAENLSERSFQEYLTDPTRTILVAAAVDADELLGYAILISGPAKDAEAALYLPNCELLEVSKFYVHPEVHGSGLAPRLMAEVTRLVSPGGCVWLGVNQQNLRAQRFYAKQGFERVGVKHFLLGAVEYEDYVLTRIS